MKHTGSYIIACIWILIAVLLGGVLVKELRGSDWGWGRNIFSWNNWFNGSFLPTDMETIETSYSEDSVKDFDVELVSSSLKVTVGSVSKVTVKITTNLPEDRRPVANLSGSTLTVKTPKGLLGNVNFNFGQYRTEVEITVPSSFNKSRNASSRDIKLNTVSGSVLVENVTVESFDIDSVSGSIKLIGIEAESVDTNSVSGSTTLEGKVRKFDIDSTSGSVHIKTFDMLTSKSSANTVSGSIHISLPENSGFTLDYSSVSGTTHNAFTGFKSSSKNRSGKDEYKNGNVKISAETISGSIHIDKL